MFLYWQPYTLDLSDKYRTAIRRDVISVVRKKAVRKKKVKGNDAEAMDWMKHHTIEDAKELVCEISSRGKDVREMVEVVRELEDIAHSVDDQ